MFVGEFLVWNHAFFQVLASPCSDGKVIITVVLLQSCSLNLYGPVQANLSSWLGCYWWKSLKSLNF